MTRKLSPELLRRIDSLSGCQGRWIVDCRALEGDYSYALRSLSEPCLYSSLLVPVGADYRWVMTLRAFIAVMPESSVMSSAKS